MRLNRRQVAGDASQRVLSATTKLLAEHGLSAVKARSVAAASGLSTMAVYHHFGGIPELIGAVVDNGYRDLERAFADLQVTDDPIADLCTIALTVRQIACESPHLYDLMFRLSNGATHAPQRGLSGGSPGFRDANRHVTGACDRLVRSGRIRPAVPDVLAAEMWSFVHGYITLELAGHFLHFDDSLRQVLIPMGVTFAVGLGDTSERAEVSLETAMRHFEADTDTGRRRGGGRDRRVSSSGHARQWPGAAASGSGDAG